ncbi:MAG: FtsQ-type POTRA domain-containing protein [Alphaproteobacteria bacterium]|nr:FtsQ-type POTRA domain-containing protein [Alphaproteobacteria bacterium]
MAAKKSKKKKARESALELMAVRLKTVGVFAVAAFVAGGITWVIKSEIVERTAEKVADSIVDAKNDITTSAGMVLEDVLVKGRKNTKAEALMDALGVYEGMPVLAIDIETAKSKVELLPWVKSAHIERRLPGTIFVSVTEYNPVAIWQNNGAFALVDEEGKLIYGASVEGYESLPILVGQGAPENVQDLMEIISSEESLKDRVKAAIRVGNRRWDVIIDDVQKGIVISLPEEDAVDAWKRLSLFNRVHGVLNRKLSSLDLRIKGRFIIRLVDSKDKGDLRSITYSAEQDI